MIAIGYQVEASQLADDLRAREEAPRERKGLNGFVFSSSWGKALDLPTE